MAVADVLAARTLAARCRGTPLIRNSPFPWDHHTFLGIGLLQGLGRVVSLTSEVPLPCETWILEIRTDALAWLLQMCSLLGHWGRVLSIAFSPDGKKILRSIPLLDHSRA